MINKYKRGDNTPVGQNFVAYEFDCSCNKCPDTLIDSELVTRLQLMRDHVNKAVTIVSGFRCADHQRFLRDRLKLETAKGVSTHEMGMAVDVIIDGYSGKDISKLAELSGFTSIGTATDWAHLDTRSGLHRWTYAGTKDT